MDFSIVLIILGAILALAGFVGCIIPVIPGPVLSYLSLITLSLARDWEPFSALFLVVMGALTIILMILDYIVPVIGAAGYGASKTGITLSIIGMFLGIFIIPPWGIFLGAFLGGIFGELLAGKRGDEALKIGWAIFLGNMASVGIKLAFALVVIFLYFTRIF